MTTWTPIGFVKPPMPLDLWDGPRSYGWLALESELGSYLVVPGVLDPRAQKVRPLLWSDFVIERLRLITKALQEADLERLAEQAALARSGDGGHVRPGGVGPEQPAEQVPQEEPGGVRA